MVSSSENPYTPPNERSHPASQPIPAKTVLFHRIIAGIVLIAIGVVLIVFLFALEGDLLYRASEQFVSFLLFVGICAVAGIITGILLVVTGSIAIVIHTFLE